MRWAGAHFSLLACLLVIGCAGDTSFRAGDAAGDPTLARAHLTSIAGAGPVPVVVRNPPASLAADTAAEQASRGIRWVKVRFVPTPESTPGSTSAAPRLLLWFDGPRVPADACAGTPTISAIPRRAPELMAAWCEGGTAVAGLVGTAADATPAAMERLVWQTTGRLFPDSYSNDYGFDMWGLKVRPSATVGF